MERVKEAIEKALQARAEVLAAATPAGMVAPPAAAAGPVAAPGPAPAPGPVPAVVPAPAVAALSPFAPAAPPAPVAPAVPGCDWGAFPGIELSARRLRHNRIITHERTEPAHVSFDQLRTRILKGFRDRGWSRLAITSPAKGCGKTFVTANLALSLARQPDLRSLVIDMDLRLPSLAQALGIRERLPLKDLLTGAVPAEVHLRRVGTNLALALNSERVRDAAELIQKRRTGEILGGLITRLAPDITVLDLPPLLVTDDAFACLPHVDAVLLVAAGGATRADQIEACERLLAEAGTNFLGVVLNKAEQVKTDLYDYGYR